MLSNYVTYETGLARIDDLRRQADEHRRAGLGRVEPTGSHRRPQRPRPSRLALALRSHRPARA
jgi:hypothetical protein